MKSLINIILSALMILLVSTGAFAEAGLSELTDIEAAVLAGLMFILLCFVPVAAFDKYLCGIFAWLQIPIIVLPIAISTVLLRRAHARQKQYLIILPILYISLTFVTNIAAFTVFKVDHAKDLPINNYLWQFRNPENKDRPIQDEITRLFGKPYSRGHFTSSSKILPDEVLDLMRTHGLSHGCTIFAYYEKAPGKYRLDERMHYLLFEPHSGRLVAYTTVNLVLERIVDKWPYKETHSAGK